MIKHTYYLAVQDKTFGYQADVLHDMMKEFYIEHYWESPLGLPGSENYLGSHTDGISIYNYPDGSDVLAVTSARPGLNKKVFPNQEMPIPLTKCYYILSMKEIPYGT